MKIFYLYRHLRLDGTEPVPFYMGVGTKNLKKTTKYETQYPRGFTTKGRNYSWEEVVKTASYRVEILLESPDKKYIAKKEREFILLYGRLDLGTGTLTNLTVGGESTYTERKERERGYEKIRDVFAYSTNGYFIEKFTSVKEAGNKLGISCGAICNIIRGKVRMGNGFVFKLKYEGESIEPVLKVVPPGRRNIVVLDSNFNLIEKISKINDASRKYKIKTSAVRECCVRKGIVDKTYRFRFEEDYPADFEKEELEKQARRLRPKGERKMYAFDRSFHLVKEFTSARQASEELMVSRSQIYTACKLVEFVAKKYYLSYSPQAPRRNR